MRSYGLFYPTYSPSYNWWFFVMMYTWSSDDWASAPVCVFKDDESADVVYNDTTIFNGVVGFNLTASTTFAGNMTITKAFSNASIVNTSIVVYYDGAITLSGSFRSENIVMFNDGIVYNGSIDFTGTVDLIGNISVNNGYVIGPYFPEGQYMFNGSISLQTPKITLRTTPGYCSDATTPEVIFAFLCAGFMIYVLA
jgi:hypothetical protein